MSVEQKTVEQTRQLPLEGFESHSRQMSLGLRLIAMGKMFWFCIRHEGVGFVETIDLERHEVRITSDRPEDLLKESERIYKPI